MPVDVPTSSDLIDRHLGARLRQLRQQHRMSLQTCGDILGVTYQQIQKYETGTNRLSVASLVHLGRWFGIAPELFYEGLEPVPSSEDPDAAIRALHDSSQFTDLQLTQSITRLSSLSRHLLNELVLAIEQSQTRRPTRNQASSSPSNNA